MAAAFLVACSSGGPPKSVGGSGDEGEGHRPADPQVGAVSGVDAGRFSPCAMQRGTCPAALPEAGASCIFDSSLICEYGDDPVYWCNTRAACGADGGWIVLGPPDGGDSGCPTVLPPACPATFGAAQDASVECPPSSLLACAYPEGICACEYAYTAADGGVGHTWACAAPQPAGCPATRPRFGAPCVGESTCVYTPNPCDDSERQCSCGAWRRAECPTIVAADNTLL